MSADRRRPTYKERNKKLGDAIEAIQDGRHAEIDRERHFTEDRRLLGSSSSKDHYTKILGFLLEIQKAGGASCYAGKFPPEKCYHQSFENDELYAFCWNSTSQRKRMYLKFSIRYIKGNPYYLYLDCHASKK